MQKKKIPLFHHSWISLVQIVLLIWCIVVPKPTLSNILDKATDNNNVLLQDQNNGNYILDSSKEIKEVELNVNHIHLDSETTLDTYTRVEDDGKSPSSATSTTTNIPKNTNSVPEKHASVKRDASMIEELASSKSIDTIHLESSQEVLMTQDSSASSTKDIPSTSTHDILMTGEGISFTKGSSNPDIPHATVNTNLDSPLSISPSTTASSLASSTPTNPIESTSSNTLTTSNPASSTSSSKQASSTPSTNPASSTPPTKQASSATASNNPGSSDDSSSIEHSTSIPIASAIHPHTSVPENAVPVPVTEPVQEERVLDTGERNPTSSSKNIEANRAKIDDFVTYEAIRQQVTEELSKNSMNEYAAPGSASHVGIRDDDGREIRSMNYASLDAGATILASSDNTKSPTNLLVPDKDLYMLYPCEEKTKWVVVSLSEDIHTDAISIANFESFSSSVKYFWVLGSLQYPTEVWTMLGNFTAEHRHGEQVFRFPEHRLVRYLKIRFISHYGKEYYCTLSQLKVYGVTFTEALSQLGNTISHGISSVETTVQPIAEEIPPSNIDPLKSSTTEESSMANPSRPLIPSASSQSPSTTTTTIPETTKPPPLTESTTTSMSSTSTIPSSKDPSKTSIPSATSSTTDTLIDSKESSVDFRRSHEMCPKEVEIWPKSFLSTNSFHDAAICPNTLLKGSSSSNKLSLSVESETLLSFLNETTYPLIFFDQCPLRINISNNKIQQPNDTSSKEVEAKVMDQENKTHSSMGSSSLNLKDSTKDSTKDSAKDSKDIKEETDKGSNTIVGVSTEQPVASGEATVAPTKLPEGPNTMNPLSPPTPQFSNLGRLESIFVTITKKIQTLEINQSVFDRYLSDIDSQYRRILNEMQAKLQGTSTKIENIVRVVDDLHQDINDHVILKEEMEEEYVDTLEKAKMENMKLQEELVAVRQVLTIMKAGITIAVGLSVVVILAFFVRLAIRWTTELIARAEERAAKSRRNLCKLSRRHEGNYLNRSVTFGTSFDDMAIQKNTFYRDLIEDSNGFRKHHVWKSLSKLGSSDA